MIFTMAPIYRSSVSLVHMQVGFKYKKQRFLSNWNGYPEARKKLLCKCFSVEIVEQL